MRQHLNEYYNGRTKKRFYEQPMFPMEAVQVDHGLCEAIVHDAGTGEPLGRPYLTIAIDYRTRLVVGLSLSLERPSALSVARCLIHAMSPKGWYLVDNFYDRFSRDDWPCHGLITLVYADHGPSFDVAPLTAICEANGITLCWRQRARPQFGQIARKVLGYNPIATRRYTSLGKEKLTIVEYERIISEYIMTVYNTAPQCGQWHRPIELWKQLVYGHGETLGCGITEIHDVYELTQSFLGVPAAPLHNTVTFTAPRKPRRASSLPYDLFDRFMVFDHLVGAEDPTTILPCNQRALGVK
jgi:putative transposase